jgi:hypothetical protein
MNDHIPRGGAPDELLGQASIFGLSHCEILQLFSDRRRFGYWRFDGEKAYVSGNLAGLTYEIVDRAEGSQIEIFHPRIEPELRSALHEKMRDAFRERRSYSATYPVLLTNGVVRMFTSSADFREHEDGSSDLFGIFYERFLPARLVAMQEAENLQEL